MIISQVDIDNISEITKLHDEAFWHLHQFDGHAKSGDGSVSIEIGFGTVWDRQDETAVMTLGVSIYSYVVATETPLYPNFGQRNHWFESTSQALDVMKEWHAKALAYQPTAEELAEADAFASDLWDVIADKVTVIDLTEDLSKNLPNRFRDISNGEQLFDIN